MPSFPVGLSTHIPIRVGTFLYTFENHRGRYSVRFFTYYYYYCNHIMIINITVNILQRCFYYYYIYDCILPVTAQRSRWEVYNVICTYISIFLYTYILLFIVYDSLYFFITYLSEFCAYRLSYRIFVLPWVNYIPNQLCPAWQKIPW